MIRIVKYVIDTEEDLVGYLTFKGLGKNKVKSLVKYNCVLVNGKAVNKLPYMLKKDDVLVIGNNQSESFSLNIIYEDGNYLVVNKEAGLLTISTSNVNKGNEDTLYRRVRGYLNSKKEYAFIVNRIDKETSGIVIFVKNQKLKKKLQDNWNKIVKERKYIALVSGIIRKDGRIDNYLYEDKMTFSHSTNKGGKRAITNYRVLQCNSKYTLLDINIETGRKNQIRVHMMEMNHPIVGDKKYGCRDNSFKKLMLCHYRISLMDPITDKLLTFEINIPGDFYELFNNS